jgi:hypothetical protein
MSAPAEIDRVEDSLISAAKAVVKKAVEQAAGAQNRLGEILRQVEAAKAAAEAAVQDVQAHVQDAQARVATAAADAQAAAEQVVTTARAKVQEAQDAVAAKVQQARDAADQAVAAAQAKVQEAENAVAAKVQQARDAAQQAVDAANAKVQQAEQAVAAGQAGAQQLLADAQARLQEAEASKAQAVANAQTAADQAVTDAQAQAQQASNAVATAVANAQTAADQAVTDARAQVQQAQDAIAGAVGAAEAQAQQALNAALELKHQAEQAVQDALGFGADKLAQLKELAAHPDVLGAVVMGLTKIVELAEVQDQVTVTVVPASDGFARGIGIRYAAPGGHEVILALALDGEGEKGAVITAKGPNPPPLKAGSILTITVTSDGNASWRIPVAGPLNAPTGQITITAVVELPTNVDLEELIPVQEFKILSGGAGKLRVTAEISATAGGAPTWLIKARLEGVAPNPGLHAQIKLDDFLGAFAGLLPLDNLGVKYNPSLDLGSGIAPAFSLNEVGG